MALIRALINPHLVQKRKLPYHIDKVEELAERISQGVHIMCVYVGVAQI